MSAKPQSKIASVVLWSVISAAFIGPGTITTAVTAGAQYQIQLLWTVVFATIACIFLQEVSARITIASGLTFGQTLSTKYGAGRSRSIKWIVAVPVLLGCAAYEAGNILGAVSGVSLLLPADAKVYTIIITLVAGVVLWKGGSRTISILMTILVGMMGVAFLVLALQADFSLPDFFASMVPVIPKGSELLVLGLVGTTIVPYNIFIGSAISKGNTVPLMRIGLSVSVVIGGLITAWIMIAGTMTGSFSSFEGLALGLQSKLGWVGSLALGVGLFAAGFSSAITAPYAASLIASTVLSTENKKSIRVIWMMVLLTGFFFGMSGVKPIPVILAVQALNGFVLPLLTYFLILLINDSKIIPRKYQHAKWYNFVLIGIFGTTLLIGLNNVDKAVTSGFNLTNAHFEIVVTVTLVALLGVAIELVRLKTRYVE